MTVEEMTIAITGAARGLGAAIARGLAARHARLALRAAPDDGEMRAILERGGRAR